MNQYEAMYVIDTALDEQVRNDVIARFSNLVTQNGGTVDRVDEWGKRRLAYPINYKTEGYYVLMYITAPSEFPRELERNLQIADSILRYLVIRFEGALPPKREALKPFVSAAHAAPVPASEVSAPAEANDAEAAKVAETVEVAEDAETAKSVEDAKAAEDAEETTAE